jgi:hypothetical protein
LGKAPSTLDFFRKATSLMLDRSRQQRDTPGRLENGCLNHE